MAFLDTLPAEIERIEKLITTTERSKFDLNWGHECDCEYCDRDGDDADDDVEEQAAKIDADVLELRQTLARMKRYLDANTKPKQPTHPLASN